MFFITLMSAALHLVQASADDVTYTIPAGEGMKEDLTFVVEEASLHHADGAAELGFRLPAFLNGKNGRQFHLHGSVVDDRITLQGTGANADCRIDKEKTACRIAFDPLKLNHEAAEKALWENGDKDLWEAIKEGREVFEHQPIGIITFHH